MRGRKTSLVVVLTEEERSQLLRWSRSTSLAARSVIRAQAIVLVAGGMPISHTAPSVGLTQRHVRQWVGRFLDRRIEGLHDLPGRGRKPSFPPLVEDYILKMACGRSLSQWDSQQTADQLIRLLSMRCQVAG